MRRFEDGMNEFTKDYYGYNGAERKLEAIKLVIAMEEAFYEGKLTFEGDGAVKWASNGLYLCEECVQALAFIRQREGTTYSQRKTLLNCDLESTRLKRNAQLEANKVERE